MSPSEEPKVYTGAGAPIENAVVLIENGRISAVGKDVAVPADARVIDATGKTVIPGLIDAASRLFLPPGEKSVGSAEQNVLDALDVYQPDYREAVEQGVTTAYVGPASLGSVNGLAPSCGSTRHTVLVKDAALKLTLGASGGVLDRPRALPGLSPAQAGVRGRAPIHGEREKYKKDLAEYGPRRRRRRKKRRSGEAEVDRDREVMAARWTPKAPDRPHRGPPPMRSRCAPARRRIQAAGRPGARHGGRTRGRGHRQGEGAGRRRRSSDTAALVDYLNHSVGTAAALVKAGVPVAIGSFGDDRAGQWGPGASRFLADSAALAASRGLTREQALAAITIEAAKILGIDKTHGSIEKGKAADLVLLSGEPFESGTVVEQTFLDGVAVYARRAP